MNNFIHGDIYGHVRKHDIPYITAMTEAEYKSVWTHDKYILL